MKKKTLVIGASENPERYAHKAIKKLNEKKHPVVALGLREGQVDGIKITTDVSDVKDIHTITMYVGPKNQPSYFDIITQLKPERLILNPGTENEALEKLAEEHQIEVIHGCTLVMLSTNQY